MSDNTQIALNSTGDVIRDKDRAGVKTQIVALDLNPAGSEKLMSGAIPTSTALGVVQVGQQTSNTSAVQISASSVPATNGVHVQAISTNVASVFVGGSSVTTGNGWELQPGQGEVFAVTDLNLLYIIGSNGTDVVCWNVL